MSGPETSDLRLGPWGWGIVVIGWVVMVVSVVGAVDELRPDEVRSWIQWVLGAALVHDLVVLPLVLGGGWLLTRLVPLPWRVPVRTAVLVAAVVSLTVWPIARRWGAREDNPSILPLPVARNLAVIVALLLVGSLVAGAVTTWRRRTGPTDHRVDLEEPAT